jgi:hypothetical protein
MGVQLGYQFKAWAMRRRVRVVTISVTMGSPAGLIVRRAWNISSGSLNSHTAMVERPQKHYNQQASVHNPHWDPGVYLPPFAGALASIYTPFRSAT